MHFDMGMLHLAILFRRESARAADEDFRSKVAAFDQRDALREEYERAKVEVADLRAQRRELELRMLKHGVEFPPDDEQ